MGRQGDHPEACLPDCHLEEVLGLVGAKKVNSQSIVSYLLLTARWALSLLLLPCDLILSDIFGERAIVVMGSSYLRISRQDLD